MGSAKRGGEEDFYRRFCRRVKGGCLEGMMVGEEDSTRPRSASMLWQPFHLGVEVFLHGIELTGAQEKEEREGGHERKGGEEGERGGLRVKISLLYQMLSVSFGAVRRKEGLTGLSFVLILPIGISLLLSSSCPHLSLNPFLFFFFCG